MLEAGSLRLYQPVEVLVRTLFLEYTFSLCPYVVERSQLLLFLLIRALTHHEDLTLMTLSRPNYHPNALFHIPSHFGVRASPYKFAKDMHQCIAVRKEKKKGRHSLKAWVIGRIAILVMDMVKLR